MVMLVVGVLIAAGVLILVSIIGSQIERATESEGFQEQLEYVIHKYWPGVVVFISSFIATFIFINRKNKRKMEEAELENNLQYKPLQPSRRG